MNKISANIVIRTFNEEDWLRHCLSKVMNQAFEDFHISIVDSGSTDATLKIIESFSNNHPEKITFTTIEKFSPGDAINRGAELKASEFIVCLSAHCIPVNDNWLGNLVSFMRDHPGVAGAYGRQQPLSCTHPDDARDLMITFGAELKFQEVEPFFHNANSIIRSDVWDDEPFDAEAPHIEDRIWAKNILMRGWRTAYLPDAPVFHYHGLHQHGKHRSFRAQNVFRVMSELEDQQFETSALSLLKQTVMLPTVIIFPNSVSEQRWKIEENIADFLTQLPKSGFYYLVDAESSSYRNDLKLIPRGEVDTGSCSLRDLLRNILIHIEKDVGTVIDGLVIFDLNYKNLSYELGEKCAQLLIDRWVPAVLPAWRDYGNYWIESNGTYKNISSTYQERELKNAFYRTVLGQGSAIRASAIRSNVEEIEAGEIVWTEDSTILERWRDDWR